MTPDKTFINPSLRTETNKEKAGKLDKIPASKRPFSRLNFLLMGVCLLLIVVGFLFMSGGGSSAETGFNPDIFSARRIVVGPLLAFLGFLCMAFAIILPPDFLEKRKKSGKKAEYTSELKENVALDSDNNTTK